MSTDNSNTIAIDASNPARNSNDNPLIYNSQSSSSLNQNMISNIDYLNRPIITHAQKDIAEAFSILAYPIFNTQKELDEQKIYDDDLIWALTQVANLSETGFAVDIDSVVNYSDLKKSELPIIIMQELHTCSPCKTTIFFYSSFNGIALSCFQFQGLTSLHRHHRFNTSIRIRPITIW